MKKKYTDIGLVQRLAADRQLNLDDVAAERVVDLTLTYFEARLPPSITDCFPLILEGKTITFQNDERTLHATHWVSGRNLIGIVATIDAQTGRWDVRIDLADEVCLPPNINAYQIGQHGAPVSKAISLACFPFLNPDTFQESQHQELMEVVDLG